MARGKSAQQIIFELEKWTGEEIAGLALEVDANLRERTPVDTGHARANWVPAVGAPHSAEVGGVSEGPHAAGVARLITYRVADGPVFASNRVPYITRLNEGHSQQAPMLFVQQSIADAIDEREGRSTK